MSDISEMDRTIEAMRARLRRESPRSIRLHEAAKTAGFVALSVFLAWLFWELQR